MGPDRGQQNAVHLTKEGFLLPTLSEEEAKPEDAALVRSFEEWEGRAGSWPLKRLVGIWNELPGVVPIQKFTSREIALERIWRFLHPPAPGSQQKRKEQSRIQFREGSKAAQVYALLWPATGSDGA